MRGEEVNRWGVGRCWGSDKLGRSQVSRSLGERPGRGLKNERKKTNGGGKKSDRGGR